MAVIGGFPGMENTREAFTLIGKVYEGEADCDSVAAKVGIIALLVILVLPICVVYDVLNNLVASPIIYTYKALTSCCCREKTRFPSVA